MNPDLARCDAEIHQASECHTDKAYLVAIWQMDWTVERALILREALRSTDAVPSTSAR